MATRAYLGLNRLNQTVVDAEHDVEAKQCEDLAKPWLRTHEIEPEMAGDGVPSGLQQGREAGRPQEAHTGEVTDQPIAVGAVLQCHAKRFGELGCRGDVDLSGDRDHHRRAHRPLGEVRGVGPMPPSTLIGSGVVSPRAAIPGRGSGNERAPRGTALTSGLGSTGGDPTPVRATLTGLTPVARAPEPTDARSSVGAGTLRRSSPGCLPSTLLGVCVTRVRSDDSAVRTYNV